jgi:hypothetical protein
MLTEETGIQNLILFAFLTRGASLSMHKRQREMHVSGSMRTVKTFPF